LKLTYPDLLLINYEFLMLALTFATSEQKWEFLLKIMDVIYFTAFLICFWVMES